MKNQMASLPQSVRDRIKERIDRGDSARQITAYLASEGHPIDYQAVARWVRQQKAADSFEQRFEIIEAIDAELMPTSPDEVLDSAIARLGAAVMALSAKDLAQAAAKSPARLVGALCKLESLRLDRAKLMMDAEKHEAWRDQKERLDKVRDRLGQRTK